MTIPVDATPPPHSEMDEMALLGCVLRDPGFSLKFTHGIAADDFYVEKHRAVWGAIHDVKDAGGIPDLIAVTTFLKTGGAFDKIGGAPFMASLYVESPSNASLYASRVREYAGKRAHGNACIEGYRASQNGVAYDEAIASTISALQSVRETYAPPSTEGAFRKAKDISDATDTTPWIIRGYVGVGLTTLVTAIPKLGKSTWVYGGVGSCERGDPEFCGCAIPEKCSAIVLSEEDDGTLAETFRLVGVSDAIVLSAARAFPRRPLSADIDSALAVFSKNPSHKILVIDTWRFWARLPPKAANDEGAVLEAYEPIAYAASQGMAPIIIHHNRKSGGEDGNASAGSNALTGAVTVHVEMNREGGKGSTKRVLDGRGRRQRIPMSQVVDFRDGRYLLSTSPERARNEARDSAIRKILVSASRWMTTPEVVESASMRKADVIAILADLHGKGDIQKTGTESEGFRWAALSTPPPHPL